MLKVLIFILFSLNLSAAELIEYTEEVTSDASNSVRARQEMLRTVSENVSTNIIRKILGEERYQQSKVSIRSKILNQTEKFIPFSRIVDLEARGGGGFKASARVKLSQESLKELLFREGFMSNIEKGVVLLPLFSLTDRVRHKNYNWWKEPVNEEDKFLIRQERWILQEMRNAFWGKGFYVSNPIKWGYYYNVPEVYRSDSMRMRDVQFLSDFYGSQMAIRGGVSFRPGSTSQTNKVSIRWTIIHRDKGRVIAESAGNYETEAGNRQKAIEGVLANQGKALIANLVQQVMEAWKKGRLSTTQIVRIDINGFIKPADIMSFKSNLKAAIPELKSVKERFFQANRVVFEVDVVGGGERLAKHLRTVDGFRVDSVRDSRVILSIDKSADF